MASAYAFRGFIQSDKIPPKASGNPDINYSSFHTTSQSCSMHSAQRDDMPVLQNAALASYDHGLTDNGSVDHKPALPPKPFQGPPTYREPPSPPVHDEPSQHPDICINSAPSHPRSADPHPYPPQTAHSRERPDHLGMRTQAWVQEHKTSGKLVGEKLSSLQRKLRSLLTQSSSNKDSVEVEKSVVPFAEKSGSDQSENWNIPSTNERPKSFGPLSYNRSSSSTNEPHMTYISSSSFSSSSATLSVSHPSNHIHHSQAFQAERHPFGAHASLSEQEDGTDPDQLRDTCTKFFSREQKISWTNYLNPRNSYSNNIKSSYDYDKLVPKEAIGRPSQDKKAEISSNCDSVYGGVTPFPSFANALDQIVQQTEPQTSSSLDASYFGRRAQNYNEENHLPDIPSDETRVPNEENDAVSNEPLQSGAADCGDTNDLYKSSSESGRGTMHSSMHGCKSVVSPHSSGISAGSNLDTSLDSDHSANGTIWGQQNHDSQEKRFSEELQVNQARHIYETPSTSLNCRKPTDQQEPQDDVTSESLSVTPPLPPLSPAPSPPISAENSPKLPSRTPQYRLSSSASALNTSCNKATEHSKNCEMGLVKVTPGKKTGLRRTSSITQTNCKHRNGKSYQYNKLPSGHRLGISHSNCAARKCHNSPPSRHHTRNQIAFPCYVDNGDPELTSTTTGLDMESLLDDADDFSSDLSATASTMEPSEVSMIRKQLEGLETMYSEILRLLGVKNSCKANVFGGSVLDVSRHSRRRTNGSLSSLNARSSVSRGNHSFADKRGFSEKRRSKECRSSSASKRLQRLESHVVTLARSVAHLSSEMRTQHVLVQELENMRQDVTWVQERLRLMQLAQGCQSGSTGGKSHQLPLPKDWDNFRREVLELLNPCRAKKLTKFFGDEPPLIRQFLKRLGYEKYAANFETEKIGIKELPYLTEERLQKMGIPMGPRMRILQEAHACCHQSQYKVYIV